MNQDLPSFPEQEPPALGDAPAPQPVRVQIPAVAPLATYILLGICVLVYLGQMGIDAVTGVDWLAVYGMKVNTWIVGGEIWRLVTPIFLHGSIVHIGFNMYALYNLGPGLERHYGHWRFLGLFMLAGFAGNVASFAMSKNPSLGSSTAIFGLLGAEGVLVYQNRRLFGNVAQRVLTNVVMIAVVNLIIGLSPGIDNWGHVGGLIGGTLFAWFAGPLLKLSGLHPNYTVEDQREPSQVWLAGIGVGLLFALLAGVLIVRGR